MLTRTGTTTSHNHQADLKRLYFDSTLQDVRNLKWQEDSTIRLYESLARYLRMHFVFQHPSGEDDEPIYTRILPDVNDEFFLLNTHWLAYILAETLKTYVSRTPHHLQHLQSVDHEIRLLGELKKELEDLVPETNIEQHKVLDSKTAGLKGLEKLVRRMGRFVEKWLSHPPTEVRKSQHDSHQRHELLRHEEGTPANRLESRRREAEAKLDAVILFLTKKEFKPNLDKLDDELWEHRPSSAMGRELWSTRKPWKHDDPPPSFDNMGLVQLRSGKSIDFPDLR